MTHAAGGTLRRFRTGLALVLLASGACVSSAASDKAPAEMAAAPQEAEIQAIRITPLDGVRPGDAALFAALLSEETAHTPLPLSITGALGAGETNGAIYFVAVIELADPEGTALHRLVREATLDRTANREQELQRIAAATAEDIAAWYASWSPPASPTLAEAAQAAHASPGPLITGSIAAPERPRFDIAFGPAPGDGARALTRALAAELEARAQTAPWLDPASLRIEGSIATASRNDGRIDVTIDWVVKDRDGRALGEIRQKNALAPARIAGEWGEAAETAAQAAADGIIAVIEPAPARIAANG